MREPEVQHSAVRMILVDNTVRCDECGMAMPPGTVIVAICVEPCEPACVIHDGGCPRSWTPTVIAGAGAEAPTQLSLPLLTAVDPREGGHR